MTRTEWIGFVVSLCMAAIGIGILIGRPNARLFGSGLLLLSLVLLVATILIGAGVVRTTLVETAAAADRPLVTATYSLSTKWSDDFDPNRLIRLRNTGQRDALAVRIGDIQLHEHRVCRFPRDVPELKVNGADVPVQHQIVESRSTESIAHGEERGLAMALCLARDRPTPEAPQSWPLSIEYQDHRGHRYRSLYRIHCDAAAMRIWLTWEGSR